MTVVGIHLQIVVQATPNIVAQRLRLLRELKDAQPSVNLALLADGKTIDVDPGTIRAVERCGNGC